MKQRKKGAIIWRVLACFLLLLLLAGLVFARFGGFSAGESADPQALAACAGQVEDILIPEQAVIVALGEATHGNREFQQLKLEVFKHLVENYGVRALALEGDFGGCEQANRYIHGGAGTAEQAAAAIGFAIYRTEEMAGLLAYMRQYNESAAPGEDLRFYGFDMQRCVYNVQFLAEACRELGVDVGQLEELVNDDGWNTDYDVTARAELITQVRTRLQALEGAEQALHFADLLLQNCQLQTVEPLAYGDLRDSFMAENTLWIAERERQLGRDRLFVSGHNGHVAKYGSMESMGKLLTDRLGEGYYAIGTDFYKSKCNMPRGKEGRRTRQVFYSHDPLAVAAKRAGLDQCWLDFSLAEQNPQLAGWINDYVYMGSLGEGYSPLMRLLPPSYRTFQPPAQLYDGMIFVTAATPTQIVEAE